MRGRGRGKKESGELDVKGKVTQEPMRRSAFPGKSKTQVHTPNLGQPAEARRGRGELGDKTQWMRSFAANDDDNTVGCI
jgi:hypothetical protein